MTSQPAVRATEREREETAEALRAAFAAGCLGESELAERAGRAYAAATRSELRALLRDIPLGLDPLPPDPPGKAPRHSLGWGWGLVLAAAGAWLIVAALHGLIAVPFILLWLVILRYRGWLPRLASRARGSGRDEI